MSGNVDLEKVRDTLIKLEDKIMISLFNRSMHKLNDRIYKPGGVEITDFSGSLLDYLFLGTERLHASVGRYQDVEERPFYKETEEQDIVVTKKDGHYDKYVSNHNSKIWKRYFEHLKRLCEEGEDSENFGRTAKADIEALQDISRRIHMGEFVARAKFQEDPEKYEKLVRNDDVQGVVDMLTNKKVEENIFERVKDKGKRYNLDPSFVLDFYKNDILPLTKEVEVEYFFNVVKDY